MAVLLISAAFILMAIALWRMSSEVRNLRAVVEIQHQASEGILRTVKANHEELNQAIANLDDEVENEYASYGDIRDLQNSVSSLQDQINDIELDMEGR